MIITKREISELLQHVLPYLSKKNSNLAIAIENKELYFFVAGLASGSNHGSILASKSIAEKEDTKQDWFYIDGNLFRDYISLLDENTLIELKFGKTLILKTAGSLAEIHQSNDLLADPKLIPFGKPSLTISGKELNAIATLTEAASTDEIRPSLQGVFFKYEDTTIEVVAADGFVLSHFKLKASKTRAGKPVSSTYSSIGINQAKRALKASEDGEVKIDVGEKGLTLSYQKETCSITAYVPSIGKEFANYQSILDMKYKSKVEVPTSFLASMIKRMNTLKASVHLQIIHGRFFYMIENEEVGKSIDSVPVKSKQTGPLMSFQISTLQDVLKACIPSESVQISFIAPGSPVGFTGYANAVVMPLSPNISPKNPFENYEVSHA